MLLDIVNETFIFFLGPCPFVGVHFLAARRSTHHIILRILIIFRYRHTQNTHTVCVCTCRERERESKVSKWEVKEKLSSKEKKGFGNLNVGGV